MFDYLQIYFGFLKASAGDLSDYQSLTSALIAVNVASPLFTNVLGNMTKNLQTSVNEDVKQYERYKTVVTSLYENLLSALSARISERENYFATPEGQRETPSLDPQYRIAIDRKNFEEKAYEYLKEQLAGSDLGRKCIDNKVKKIIDKTSMVEPELTHHFPTLILCAAAQFIFLIITTLTPKAQPYTTTEIVIFIFLSATSYKAFSTLFAYTNLIKLMSKLAKQSRHSAIVLMPYVDELQEKLNDLGSRIANGDHI